MHHLALTAERCQLTGAAAVEIGFRLLYAKMEFREAFFLLGRANRLGGDAEENAAITRAILAGEPGPKRDIALINALPAIVAFGLAEGFAEAFALAAESIDSGAAAGVLAETIELGATLAVETDGS